MAAQLRMAVALFFALSLQAVLGEMAAHDAANLRGAPESSRRMVEGGGQCCYGHCGSGECNPPVHFCSSEETCLTPTSEGGCDSSGTGGAKAVWCPDGAPSPTPYPVPAPPTKPPTPPPTPPLFTVVSPNTGCSNFASLPELGRFLSVSNAFCAQQCLATKGCVFWTYQDEANKVCEAAQPYPTPLQPALGDDACILFGGQCEKEDNACYDVVTLSPPPPPAPPLFTVVSPNTGCSNFASLPELGRFHSVSNVFCAQACSVTKGCTFWTYQDEPNKVCEAAQPFPTPLQPALGDDACILFGGQCKQEENACWDVVTLAGAPVPFPQLICNGTSGFPLFCKPDATCCGALGSQICCGPTGQCAGNVFSPVCVAQGTCSGLPVVCDGFSGPLCSPQSGAMCCGQDGFQIICAPGFECGGTDTTPICVLP